MRRFRLVVALLIPIACAAAPSKNGAPPTDPAAAGRAAVAESSEAEPSSVEPVPKEQMAARLADAVCQASAPCCEPTGAVYDAEQCRRFMLENWQKHLASVQGYDGEAAARCLEDVNEVARGCNAAHDEVAAVPSCAQAFQDATKLRKTGESCNDDADCAHSERGIAFCYRGGDTSEGGRCALETPPRRAATCYLPGGSKTDEVEFSNCSADPDLRCNPETGTCGPRAQAGETCAAHHDCAGSALCHADKCTSTTGKPCSSSNQCGKTERCTKGRCGPGGELGDSCQGLSDCAEGMCARNSGKCSTWAATFLCRSS
jgi:hypothetical protein